jgi:PiT family inorganic phosphate transporter
VQSLILDTVDPLKNAKRYVPVYIFLTGFMISLVTVFKGLKHVGLEMTKAECYLIAGAIGIVLAIIGTFLINRIEINHEPSNEFDYQNVERVFGPVAAVVGIVNSGGIVDQKMPLPPWVLLLGGVGIVAGLMTYGYKVIATIGQRITELTPSRGFCCEMAAAATVVLASGTGLPISTTHTLVGAVLGVGFARGISALNLRIVGTIFMPWIITLPIGAVLAIIFFFIFKTIFYVPPLTL